MSKFNNQILQKLDKPKLIRLLEREGIDASAEQPKPELIRLLMLAKRANAPTRPKSINITSANNRKIAAILTSVAIIVIGVSLYLFNPIFEKNINFLFGKISGEPSFVGKNTGPTIYEKNGKTYVVYDHPLIDVDVLYDPECKRPECNLDSYYKQVKSYITPLINFNEVPYNSREGQKLAEAYKLNLMPVFLFENIIEQTENFENSKKNLEKILDKYILQVPPVKVINGPNLTNGQIIGLPLDKKAPITIVEYSAFSCKLCNDNSATINSIFEMYPDQVTKVVKYFNTGSKDTEAAIAAECAGQQNKFKEYYDLLYSRQDDWVNLAESGLPSKFTGYALELGLARNTFNQCQVDPNTKQIAQNHYTEAGSLGISAAPTILVNNNVLVGSYTPKNLATAINDILLSEGKTIKSNSVKENEAN